MIEVDTYIHHNKMNWVSLQGNHIGYRHDKSCVHNNQQLRVDKLSECMGHGIIAIPRFGKLIADDRG